MRDGKELPIEQQMFRANLNRTVDPVAVTPGGGWWTVSVNGPATAYVGNYSDPATPPQSALYRIDGTRVRWIEENRLDAGHPFAPYASRLRAPEFGTMQSHGQTLVWRMTTPPDFDPSKTYPVVMQVYGGPGTGAGVQKSWQPLTNQLLTEAGYIVFRVDNRGEGDRSQAFETSIYRRLGIPAVEDQASARAHRRGQTRPVTVHRFFYINTVEDVIDDRMKRKRELATTALVGTDVLDQEMDDILRALRISPTLIHQK